MKLIFFQKTFLSTFILCLMFSLTSCSSFSTLDKTKPKNTENICAIFKEKKGWYRASYESYSKWAVPVSTQMAIIHQESHFVADAKPPGKFLFGFIPWFGTSSAYGYPQAKDEVWSEYLQKSGNKSGERDNFTDACDFIGWYSQVSNKRLGISKADTKNLYLAYHEGHGGFKKQSYNQKPWLLTVANKVARRSREFEQQLASCSVSD